jgi:hypothetical protein
MLLTEIYEVADQGQYCSVTITIPEHVQLDNIHDRWRIKNLKQRPRRQNKM